MAIELPTRVLLKTKCVVLFLKIIVSLLLARSSGLQFFLASIFFVFLVNSFVTVVDALVEFLLTFLLTYDVLVSEWLVFVIAFLEARK